MSAPRLSRSGDEPGLRALWQTVFADDDGFLDDFFSLLYRPGSAALVEEDGRIVSAAYVIELENAAYLYAVATHPDCRGKGYAKAVTLAVTNGRPAYLYPASDSLRQWYAREFGAVSYSCAPCRSAQTLLSPMTPSEYKAAREALLQGRSHAVYPLAYLEFFARHGGFYRTPTGICAVDNGGAVKEALPGERKEVYIMALNGAPPLYHPLVLD